MWKLYLWNCNLLINIANNLSIQLSVRFIHWFLYRFHIAIVESSIYRKRNFHRCLLINRANLLLAEQSAVRHFDCTMNCIIRKIYFVTTKICKKKLIIMRTEHFNENSIQREKVWSLNLNKHVTSLIIFLLHLCISTIHDHLDIKKTQVTLLALATQRSRPWLFAWPNFVLSRSSACFQWSRSLSRVIPSITSESITLSNQSQRIWEPVLSFPDCRPWHNPWNDIRWRWNEPTVTLQVNRKRYVSISSDF